MAAITFSCGKEPSDTPSTPDTPTEDNPEQPADSVLLKFEADIEYVYDDTDFKNPERGQYITIGYNYNIDTNEVPAAMTAERMRQYVRDADMTLSFSEFYINGTFQNEYSEEFLEMIRENFRNHRKAGIKSIVRFVYVYKGEYVDPKPCNPSVEMTLRHVEQLKPVFQEFADVILVLQAGFIGECGEWVNPVPSFSKQQKGELMTALLDAMPKTRQVAMRTPDQKMSVLRLNRGDTLTVDVAFSDIPRARVCGHNDCFLANGNDAGTYNDKISRLIWKIDTRYTLMGGETCLSDPTYCNCPAAYENLEDYHWTYLNSTYNVNALTLLDEGGCFKDIRKRLGYRIYLDKAAFDGTWTAGGQIDMQFSVSNCGFASIINPRAVEFVIEAADNRNDRTVMAMDKDPRFWQAGTTNYWEERINLPDNLKPGTRYNLYLNLPDPEKTLHDNPEFSIRLANKNTWDEEQGMNLIYTFKAE